MPCYDYRCTACGHRWDTTESIGEHDRRGPEKACPKCGQPTAERVLSPAAIHFAFGCSSKDGFSRDTLTEDDLH
jgi:putative FmdB family regulatory protein